MPSSENTRSRKPVPERSGIGLRAEHYQEILGKLPDIGWLEVHSENYFGDGGRPLFYLEKLAHHYPLSFHGVGLSIGSTDKLDIRHLKKLKNLIDQFQPGLVSEHLSWGSFQGTHFNDLFPMPYTSEALKHMAERINYIQEYLGRQILIENVSSYLQFEYSEMTEWEFLEQLAAQAGCGILLDVNNIYVNACNHGFDGKDFINSISRKYVQEIHLAGHTTKHIDGNVILIDTHNQRVTDKVWSLYEFAIRRFGKTSTLIEWDSDLPTLDTLLDEANMADRILQTVNENENSQHIA